MDTEQTEAADAAEENEDKQQEDTSRGFATTNQADEGETLEESVDALFEDEDDDGDDGEEQSVMDVIEGAQSLLDDGLDAVAEVIAGLAEDAELEDGSEPDAPDISTARSVLAKVVDLTQNRLWAFLDEVGAKRGAGYDPRIASLEEAEGETASGDKIAVAHNKARTAIQLRIGKKRVAEQHAASVLRRLVLSNQARLDALTMSFIPETGDEQGEDLEPVTLSASDPESCRMLIQSAVPIPSVWVWRDVESLCGEVAASVDLARELVDSNLVLESGGVRCIKKGKDGKNVDGMHRWIFINGTVHSIRWLDGDRRATETLRLVTAVEMLAEMYSLREEGWTDFQLLPNLDAIASIRRQSHTDEMGRIKATQTDSAPHSVDTSIIYSSADAEDDGSILRIASVNQLWNVVRDHAGRAFEENLQGPMENLASYKDLIDQTLSETAGALLGMVESDFLVKTAEQFESVEPDPLPDDEDQPDDEDDAGFEPTKASLGSAEGAALLERFGRQVSGEDDDDGDDAKPRRPARLRGRGKVAGQTRRSRF